MTEHIVGQLIESNVFVVSNKDSCVIVDAGVETDEVEHMIAGKKVAGIFLTHGHYDHCFYALQYAKRFGCAIYGSEFLREYLSDGEKNYSEGKFVVNDFSMFKFLKGKGEIKVGDFVVQYTQLGGHSKSDMVFKIGKEIFVGDILLGRDMGRIDLIGGSKEEMAQSLKFLCDEDYEIMHSGHGADNSKTSQDKVARIWLRFLTR